MKNALLVGLGLVAGILGGLLGIGGAVIIIPALVLFLGYSQYEAQGTTLAMLLLPVSALAAVQYYRGGYVDVKAALIMGYVFPWRLHWRKTGYAHSSRSSQENLCCSVDCNCNEVVV